MRIVGTWLREMGGAYLPRTRIDHDQEEAAEEEESLGIILISEREDLKLQFMLIIELIRLTTDIYDTSDVAK